MLKAQPLSPMQVKHAARALDLLTIVARGLQDVDCPAMALVCAAQDLLVMTTMSLLALASQGEGGPEGETYTQAVEFTRDMVRDLERELSRWATELPERFAMARRDQQTREENGETTEDPFERPFVHKMGKLRH